MSKAKKVAGAVKPDEAVDPKILSEGPEVNTKKSGKKDKK